MKIRTVEQVIDLAQRKRAVVFRGSRIAAAFVQNWQARLLVREIRRGNLSVYRKGDKR